MIDEYLLNATYVTRVPTVDDALELRDKLQVNGFGELVSFKYVTKYNKKTEEEYQVVTAKIEFTTEKDPDKKVYISYSDSAEVDF